MKITDVDANMKAAKTHGSSEQTIRWHVPTPPLFRLAGFAFGGRENGYYRLPLSALPALSHSNPAFELLAGNTAGGQLYFCTDSTALQIKVTLRAAASLCHMTATGECGFDCYRETQGTYQFVNAVKYDQSSIEYTFTFFSGLPADDKKILLNFPLYCGVKEVLIGLDADASLRTPPSFSQKGRVVVYGTSITQGGCASRPGMAYSNLLSRRLGIEFINFGFSGNGNGEPEVAALVSSVADARLFILDYEANAGLCGKLEQTFDGLIDAVRGAYAHIPILVLSMPKVSSLMYSEKERGQMEKRRAFMRKNIADRTQKGDDRLFFLSGETLLGDDWHECTVDGMHPNDLGFYRIAQALAKPIVALLRQNESKGEEK